MTQNDFITVIYSFIDGKCKKLLRSISSRIQKKPNNSFQMNIQEQEKIN